MTADDGRAGSGIPPGPGLDQAAARSADGAVWDDASAATGSGPPRDAALDSGRPTGTADDAGRGREPVTEPARHREPASGDVEAGAGAGRSGTGAHAAAAGPGRDGAGRATGSGTATPVEGRFSTGGPASGLRASRTSDRGFGAPAAQAYDPLSGAAGPGGRREERSPAAPGPAPMSGRPGAGGAATAAAASTGVNPDRRVERPDRPDRPATRVTVRPDPRRPRHARLVLHRIDPWSVFLFSVVASICLGIVLLVAVGTLYAVLSGLGVLAAVNGLLSEVFGSTGSGQPASTYITAGRVLGVTAVLAAVDVVLLTVLATLSALLYNLCSALTGGIEVDLREHG